jgi:hypothetical protein
VVTSPSWSLAEAATPAGRREEIDMGKRKDDERDYDPMLCSACGTSLMHHCSTCQRCNCRGGAACPDRNKK